MNNDIAFLIAKYLEGKTGYRRLDLATESNEVIKERRFYSADILNKRLANRPSILDLENKNIIRNIPLDFEYIHGVLETINFKENKNKISPRIAGIVKRLDFAFKKRMIITKLNLDEYKRKKR